MERVEGGQWRVAQGGGWVAGGWGMVVLRGVVVLGELGEGNIDNGVEYLRCVWGVACCGGGRGGQAAVEGDTPGGAHPGGGTVRHE